METFLEKRRKQTRGSKWSRFIHEALYTPNVDHAGFVRRRWSVRVGSQNRTDLSKLTLVVRSRVQAICLRFCWTSTSSIS